MPIPAHTASASASGRIARLHLVDGTFELFRAHFAKRPSHTAPDGQPVKATVGLASSLLALTRDVDEAVTHLAVAFDNPIRSFRNDLFPAYKSDEGMDPELRSQFDLVEEVTRALGIAVWSMDELEADDALAAGVVRYLPEVDEVRLMTPDKDMQQCLAGERVVLVDRIRKKERREADLRELRGFGPASLPDFLALVGDTADGIPGLPGFGERSTQALLARFEHLENIPASAAGWKCNVRGADRLAATLAERREDAMLYRTLATLRTDVLPEEPLEALAWRGVPPEGLAWIQERLGLSEQRARSLSPAS